MNKRLKFIIIGSIILLLALFAALTYSNFWQFTKKTGTVSEEEFQSHSSCIILDEGYCAQGKLVYEDGGLIGLGFKVPEGTNIYAPFNGGLDSTENTLIKINQRFYSGLTFRNLSLDSGERDFFMVLGYHQAVTDKQVFNKGEAFAQAGVFTFDEAYLGGYNLILTFRNLNEQTGEWVNNFDLLKQFFNYIEEQP